MWKRKSIILWCPGAFPRGKHSGERRWHLWRLLSGEVVWGSGQPQSYVPVSMSLCWMWSKGTLTSASAMEFAVKHPDVGSLVMRRTSNEVLVILFCMQPSLWLSHLQGQRSAGLCSQVQLNFSIYRSATLVSACPSPEGGTLCQLWRGLHPFWHPIHLSALRSSTGRALCRTCMHPTVSLQASTPGGVCAGGVQLSHQHPSIISPAHPYPYFQEHRLQSTVLGVVGLHLWMCSKSCFWRMSQPEAPCQAAGFSTALISTVVTSSVLFWGRSWSTISISRAGCCLPDINLELAEELG